MRREHCIAIMCVVTAVSSAIFQTRCSSRFKCPRGYDGYCCCWKCQYPQFGDDCKQKCDCGVDLCDHVTGCSTLRSSCPVGYAGKYSNTQCPYPRYGVGCQQKCVCSRRLCSASAGCPITKNNKLGIVNNELKNTPFLFTSNEAWVRISSIVVAVLLFTLIIIHIAITVIPCVDKTEIM